MTIYSKSKTRSSTKNQFFKVRVTLQGTKPLIWRIFNISASANLNHLHYCIQGAFGWYLAHMHLFNIDNNLYADPKDSPYEDEMPPIKDKLNDEFKFILGRNFMVNDSFEYVYNMYAQWTHKVDIIDVYTSSSSKLSNLETGSRACPPELANGIENYEKFKLLISKKPNSQEVKELRKEYNFFVNPSDFNIIKQRKFFNETLAVFE